VCIIYRIYRILLELGVASFSASNSLTLMCSLESKFIIIFLKPVLFLLFQSGQSSNDTGAHDSTGNKVRQWFPGAEETETGDENETEVDNVGLEDGLLGGTFVGDLVLSSEDSVVFLLGGDLLSFGFAHGVDNFSTDTFVDSVSHFLFKSEFSFTVSELQNVSGDCGENGHNVPS